MRRPAAALTTSVHGVGGVAWRQRLAVNGAASTLANDELVSHYRELFEQLADDLAKTLRDEQFVRAFLARGES